VKYVVYDIETVPTSGVGTVPDPTPEKPDPFPPLTCHVPVVIGVMVFNEDYMPVVATPIVGDEKMMLEEFSRMAGGNTLVSWNGRRFDMPVIVLRCFHHGVPLAWYYQARDMRYRFTDAGHFDVMDFVSDFGAAQNVSLDGIAKLIGLPGKMDVSGADVATLVAAGKVDEVARYCMTDVAQTAFPWLRTQFVRGVISLTKYQEAAEALVGRLKLNPVRYGELLAKTDLEVLLLKKGNQIADQVRVPETGGDDGVDQDKIEAPATGDRPGDSAPG
jgi:3'-5' exonuclease